MQRLAELMRKHTKAELLRMDCAGGLVRHNSPGHRRKDETAAVMNELRAAARPAAARSARVSRPAQEARRY
jgi:hypothetical protein